MASMCLFTDEWLQLGDSTVQATVQATEKYWSFFGVTIRFLITFLTKDLLLDHSIWLDSPLKARWFHLWMMEFTVLTGTFSAVLFPNLCLNTILSQRSTDSSLGFMT